MRTERDRTLARFLRLVRNEVRGADPVRLRRPWRRADLGAYDTGAYAVARAMVDGASAEQAMDMLRTELAAAFDRRASGTRLSILHSRLQDIARDIDRELPPLEDVRESEEHC